MRNPMRRGHGGGQLERRERGSLAQAESWHGGSERWGLWPAVGEPTTSDRGWPMPPSCLSRGYSASHGELFLFHMRGVLVGSRVLGGWGSPTALSGSRGEGGPSSGPFFKGAPETSIVKINILMQILKNQKSMQKILMSKMPNFQRGPKYC